MHAKPNWVLDYVPALDGLRGIAILLVLLHHCEPRLLHLGLGGVAHWGWTGVNLFFVLSGYLITGIILDGRPRPKFFRNFYARRALRIWPVYALVVPFNFWIYGRGNTWNGHGTWWVYFVLFIQNLAPGLTGTIYPTWSLAIEEQFYVVWAPIARRLPAAGLAALLAAVLAVEPWIRGHFYGWFTPINTLYHLDGLAVGALIALGLRTTRWPRGGWRTLAIGGLAAGLAAGFYAWLWGGPYFDSLLALCFGGLVLFALLGEARGNLYTRALKLAPLRFLGKISYGLYLVHMPIFAILGGVDAHMDRVHAGAAGDLTIVALRWTASIAAATLLWYGFEQPLLRLKRYFKQPAAAPQSARAVA